MTSKIFPKGGVFNNLLGEDMHSHERLLALSASVLTFLCISSVFVTNKCSLRIKA